MAGVWRYPSPLGDVCLSSDGEALTGLWFDGMRRDVAPGSRSEADTVCAVCGRDLFERAVAWLDCYFAGGRPDFGLPIRMGGSPFREEVWRLLLQVPYGETVSYGELSHELARRRGGGVLSAQAVGGAVGSNPILLFVPCHRVVGYDGRLTGYSGGLERKAALLRLEGADPTVRRGLFGSPDD